MQVDLHGECGSDDKGNFVTQCDIPGSMLLLYGCPQLCLQFLNLLDGGLPQVDIKVQLQGKFSSF